MKKEMRIVVDTEKARTGLFLHGNYNVHNLSDDEILDAATKHVGEFASQFGFEEAQKQPELSECIERDVKIKIDTKIAKRMLGVAGFYDLEDKSDDDIVRMVLRMIECYGANYDL